MLFEKSVRKSYERDIVIMGAEIKNPEAFTKFVRREAWVKIITYCISAAIIAALIINLLR